MSTPEILPVVAAYELWAPTYAEENPVTLLEMRAVRILSRHDPGRLLDAGCGTGRRLPAGAAGIDLSLAMLRLSGRRGALANADVRRTPFLSGTFDAVWFRLAAGHLPGLAPAYRELARVAAPGARVVVTDFHPEAARAGLSRTFKVRGATFAVEHFTHGRPDHARAAREAGLRLHAEVHLSLDQKTAREGGLTEEKARAAGSVPLVLGLAFEKEAPRG
ncbi:MAG: hypothetical protein DIJKHBIC_00892 [Thermoanaerobaculia bacterium]|nr:hypothetical protein [Thermoanaerobaculia bacterium]